MSRLQNTIWCHIDKTSYVNAFVYIYKENSGRKCIKSLTMVIIWLRLCLYYHWNSLCCIFPYNAYILWQSGINNNSKFIYKIEIKVFPNF